MYVPVQSHGGGSAQQGIPLGLTYAPVQMVGQRQQNSQSSESTPIRSGSGVTIVSTELNEHWAALEEVWHLHLHIHSHGG